MRWTLQTALLASSVMVLQLSATQAQAAPNLALKKATRQSSTAFGGASSRAVDGNVEGNYFKGSVTHTNLDSPAWWEVDLGREHNIGRVVIYNRTDCCAERLSGARLMVLSSKRKVRYNRAVGSRTRITRVVLSAARGRYIRIQITQSRKRYLSLAEVRVYGVKTTRSTSAKKLDPRAARSAQR
jgi:hypothetical protein